MVHYLEGTNSDSKMRNDTEILHKSVTKYDNDDLYVKDCEDDGESAAGGRMLHLLEILDVKNILVIVSRYFFYLELGRYDKLLKDKI